MITRASLALSISALLAVFEAPFPVVLIFVVAIDALVYPEAR